MLVSIPWAAINLIMGQRGDLRFTVGASNTIVRVAVALRAVSNHVFVYSYAYSLVVALFFMQVNLYMHSCPRVSEMTPANPSVTITLVSVLTTGSRGPPRTGGRIDI